MSLKQGLNKDPKISEPLTADPEQPACSVSLPESAPQKKVFLSEVFWQSVG